MAIGQAKKGEPIPRLHNHEEHLASQAGPRSAAPGPHAPPAAFHQEPISQAALRTHVEEVARQCGLPFHPHRQQQAGGRQVFAFGSRAIYFDGTAIVLYNPLTAAWDPVSIQHLLSFCR